MTTTSVFVVYVISLIGCIVCVSIRQTDNAILFLGFAILFRTFAIELKIKS